MMNYKGYILCVHLAAAGGLQVHDRDGKLIVPDIGDIEDDLFMIQPFDIHGIKWSGAQKFQNKPQVGRSALAESVDYSEYLENLPDFRLYHVPGQLGRQSEHLVDLPDDLKEQQDALLEGERGEDTFSHDIEVDPITGWPWYMATIPPGDFYDCLFLYFSCTDYERPGWPGNKLACMNLFDYCITYTETNRTETDDPFITKIPVSSEIITRPPRPARPPISFFPSESSESSSASSVVSSSTFTEGQTSSSSTSTSKPPATTEIVEKPANSGEIQQIENVIPSGSSSQSPPTPPSPSITPSLPTLSSISSTEGSIISGEGSVSSSESTVSTDQSSSTPDTIVEDIEESGDDEEISQANGEDTKEPVENPDETNSNVESDFEDENEGTTQEEAENLDSEDSGENTDQSLDTGIEDNGENQQTDNENDDNTETDDVDDDENEVDNTESEAENESEHGTSEENVGNIETPDNDNDTNNEESESISEMDEETDTNGSSNDAESDILNESEENQIIDDSQDSGNVDDITGDSNEASEDSVSVSDNNKGDEEIEDDSSNPEEETDNSDEPSNTDTGNDNVISQNGDEVSEIEDDKSQSPSSELAEIQNNVSSQPPSESTANVISSSTETVVSSTDSSSSSLITDNASSTSTSTISPTVASSITETSTSNTSPSVATASTTSPTTISTTSSTTEELTTGSSSADPSVFTTPESTTSTTPEQTSSSTAEPSTTTITTTTKRSTVGAVVESAAIGGLGLPTPKPGPPLGLPTPKPSTKEPASCSDLFIQKGIKESGIYSIFVSGEDINVYCDMETYDGGWTVLQRRGDYGNPDDNFLKNWDDYKNGFGDPNQDHWVGLKYWNNITLTQPQQLLIEMEDWDGNTTQVAVNNFIIGTEFYKFRIIYASVDGEFGESLPKKGTKFSTQDNDNDAWRNNCAARFKGAWWYSACHNSNLNGLYLRGEHESFGNGVNWYHWKGYHYSLKSASMKVRPQSKAVSLRRRRST